MKLFKKASAVLLALAMIAVMIPQMESKVVKAAEPSQTYVWNANEQADNTTVGVIQAHADTGKTGVTTNATGTDPDDGTKYTQGLKTQSSTYFNIIVPEGKFVKVTVVAVLNSTSEGAIGAVQLDTDASTNKTITALNKTTADKVTMAGYLTEGTHKLSYCVNSDAGFSQLFIFKVIADVYDNASDVPKDEEVSEVKVSGTVKSSVSLEGGQIKLGAYTGDLTLKAGTSDEYTYEIENVEGDGAEYSVKIEAPKVTEGLMNIASASLSDKVRVDSEDTVADFTLQYINLDGLTWNFTDTTKNWQTITYQNASGKYKGLEIDATATGNVTAKFDVQSTKVQINEGTKVNIPVSGWGTVTCTFSGTVTGVTTLGETTGSGKTSITYNYQNAEWVELSIGVGNSGLYLEKIEVVPDTTPVVSQLGASVRQETEEWGNGIRFGGQLDLTKVDKDTCTSGTLIGLAATVGEGNEMTLEDATKTCVNVVRTTYIEDTGSLLDYAAALVNIPDNQLDTKIVARPYVTVDGTTYYGEQITTTYNEAVTKAANVQ